VIAGDFFTKDVFIFIRIILIAEEILEENYL